MRGAFARNDSNATEAYQAGSANQQQHNGGLGAVLPGRLHGEGGLISKDDVTVFSIVDHKTFYTHGEANMS